MKQSKKKYYSLDDALELLKRYCAYQERCHQEVRTKLIEIQIYGDDLENIISELINENFLNEERFARAYARGKYRIKKWGRNKIKQELKFRKISAYCIKKAMTEIDEDEYLSNLDAYIEKKLRDYKTGKMYQRKQKIFKFCYQKGYESHLINEALKGIES